jgi:ribose 1,5-bisphosphokinase PhnN
VPENANEITHAGSSATGRDNMINPIREAPEGAVSFILARLIITAISQTGRDTYNRWEKGILGLPE